MMDFINNDLDLGGPDERVSETTELIDGSKCDGVREIFIEEFDMQIAKSQNY